MKLLSIFLFSALLVGCGLINNELISNKTKVDPPFNHIVSYLIEQLIRVEQFDYQIKSVAFTTLVWMDSLTVEDSQREDILLGHQISSSLKVELVQRGGKVVEHKSPQTISISKKASYYLTRNLVDLPESINVDYVLVGTMLAIKDGVTVNIEVIDIESHQVVSSANTFISNDLLPELKYIYMKEDKIYRG